MEETIIMLDKNGKRTNDKDKAVQIVITEIDDEGEYIETVLFVKKDK